MINLTSMGHHGWCIPFGTLRICFASDVEICATRPTPVIKIAKTAQSSPHGKMAILSIKLACQSVSFSTSKAWAQTPPQTMPTTHAPSAMILPTVQLAATEIELCSVLYIHMTLYIAYGWCHMLHDSDISHLFPLLVNDIVYGLPIRNPPPLQHTFIPKNLPSTHSLLHIVDDEIASELAAK